MIFLFQSMKCFFFARKCKKVDVGPCQVIEIVVKVFNIKPIRRAWNILHLFQQSVKKIHLDLHEDHKSET